MAFFERTIGWRFETEDLGGGRLYHVAMSGDRPIAGVMPMLGPEFEGLPSRWMTYVAVTDVDATLKKVDAHGGLLLSGPTDVARVGRLAVVRDPTGGVAAFLTPENM